MSWDTIVVGSGPGGLSAATALARAGQKVLVLEQHYLPGGWAHSFQLGGYRWSPGIHYLGDLGPQGGLRAMFDGLGVLDALDLVPLNRDGFDHFIVGGERFDQPAGVSNWVTRLQQRFPDEREGIARYFATLKRIATQLQAMGSGKVLDMLAAPFRLPGMLRSLGSLIDACVKDPVLRGVLAGQCGNHGLPPSRVPVAVHAMMAAHYFEGGWYPRGGAKMIPQAMIKQLKSHGGRLRVRSRVKQILVEDGRTCGVELESGERISAGNVVCNADPAVVYGQLLDEKYGGSLKRKAEKMEYSTPMISAFCAVDMDLSDYDSGNYWWYRDADIEGAYQRTANPVGDALDILFLSITSLKDPSPVQHGHHTVELLTFAPWSQFEGRARDEAYYAEKKSLGEKMVATAEQVIPGFSRHVKFLEVGTPLTNVHFCNSWKGASYGTAKTRWQVGPFGFQQKGPVEGLHLCGASTLAHGYAGAAFSGVLAAQNVLGLSKPDTLLEPHHGTPALAPAHAA